MASSTQIRKTLANLTAKRADIEKKISQAHQRKAAKEQEAASRATSAGRTSSDASRRMYLRQEEGARRAALAETKKITALSMKLAEVSGDEGKRNKELAKALEREANAEIRAAATERSKRERAERGKQTQRKTEERRRQQERVKDQQTAAALVSKTEQRLTRRIDGIRPPRKEQLRILYATASPGGDLRVDEEIRRVKQVVRASTHREQVLIEHLPAATAGDLLDGLVTFRPHVVHFSGHADDTVLVFDDGSDTFGEGHHVTARAFKAAVEAPDEPPMLVVLNACKSAAQLNALLGGVPLAIGMSDSIGDVDAITFATRFYRSLAEGQSVAASLAAARAEMQMNGLPDHDLPTLAAVDGLDPANVRLIIAPE